MKFDKIGAWSELKLDLVEKYGAAYTNTFNNHPGIKKFYIDGFSGAGEHISKASGERVEGSPSRALKVTPPFDHFYFIDLEAKKTDYLRSLYGDNPKVTIKTGDATKILTQEILPPIKYEDYKRALCLLDPYGLDLDWQVIEMAGKLGTVDIFLNFPVMDMNRNAIWRNPDNVPPDGIERMNRFWGNESWRGIAYKDHAQLQFFSPPDKVKQDNDTIAAEFGERLKKIAGFKYVAKPLPMRNSKKAIVYYLMLASPKEVATDIIEAIFRKHR